MHTLASKTKSMQANNIHQ